MPSPDSLSPSSDHQDALFQLTSAFVKRGLLQFWQSALPEDQVIVPLLRSDLKKNWPEAEAMPWDKLCSEMEKKFSCQESVSPFITFAEDYELSLAELFVFSLLGSLQIEHLVNMAISELQLPDKSPNLSVHMAGALVDTLFGEPLFEKNLSEKNLSKKGLFKKSYSQTSDTFIYSLLESPLVRDKLMSVSDDATLPLCKLKIQPVIWSVLSGRNPPWVGCRFFNASEVGNVSYFSRQEALKIAELFLFDTTQVHSQHIHLQEDLDKHATNNIDAIVIRGVPNSGRLAFVSVIAHKLGLKLLSVPDTLWQENSALSSICHYAGWLPVVQPQLGPGQNFKLPAKEKKRKGSPLAIILGIDGAVEGENLLDIHIHLPKQEERLKYWENELNNKPLAATISARAMLSLNSIKSIATSAKQLAKKQNASVSLHSIFAARRYYGSEKLRVLAEQVNREVQRDAMAFPGSVQEGLDLLLLRAKQRESIWQSLGKTLKITPSPGVRALFVGESGTGKTMAASFIATELGAPLYRVDLSSVMNKYIGESEKNLSQLLDHAAAMDVVLLFDEADSLFGSRSEGKETGERFANMLTNFLLTRIENHPGVVILTTNGKERIDNAFNRRIDVEVNFPVPGYEERLNLWQGHLGEQILSPKTCSTIASYCDFAGGQVRNAVLAAATYAQGEAITIETLLKGIRLEYAKIGRDVPKVINQLESTHLSKVV